MKFKMQERVNNSISLNPFCCRNKSFSEIALFAVISEIQRHIDSDDNVSVNFTDIEKASDYVDYCLANFMNLLKSYRTNK